MRLIEELFAFKRSPDDFNRKAKNIVTQFKNDRLYLLILVDIYKQQEILLGWRRGTHIPTTTNLIECFNSHLQDRLKTLQGFETVKHADLWLNAYFLRRRMKRFSGCSGKFRHLNGYTSLEKSQKPNVAIPRYFR